MDFYISLFVLNFKPSSDDVSFDFNIDHWLENKLMNIDS